MKKIVIISGSPRTKGNTYKITRVFEEKMNAQGAYEFEYVSLKKVDLQYCRGCLVCMKRGEEFCPCKDDALEIRDKLLNADGVVFTSPVYVHTVSAMMKNFFDRFAFYCHQPHFIGKSAMLLVTTELSGGKETLEYMKFPVNTWGFKIADSIEVVYPSYKENPAYQVNAVSNIEKAAQKFHRSVMEKLVDYSLQKFVFFNLLKLKVTLHKNMLPRDFAYWQEMGWLDLPFYTGKNVPIFKSFLSKNMVKFRSKSILKKAGVIVNA